MLLGDRNVCGPTLANMGEQFGLSILIGKSAAIIADARIGGKTDSAVVAERLLSISGEDLQTIPRKFLPDWNGKLPVRFMILTNELPGIEDSSGALASRFLILTLTKSFFGKEDHNLLDRFIPELPGILLWALEGWDRLYKRGRFLQTQCSEQLIQTFEDLGSPISAFVREVCEIGAGFETLQAKLFDEWKTWCKSTGRERPGTAQAFGRNLRAAFPWLKVERPRVDGDQMRFWQGIRIRSDQS
jgi:putative DNA primase/helicase